jgi:hypothetical protein
VFRIKRTGDSMNKLNVFMIHRMVGGLAPGALPHEESVWCRSERLLQEEPCAPATPEAPERPSMPTPAVNRETSR